MILLLIITIRIMIIIVIFITLLVFIREMLQHTMNCTNCTVVADFSKCQQMKSKLHAWVDDIRGKWDFFFLLMLVNWSFNSTEPHSEGDSNLPAVLWMNCRWGQSYKNWSWSEHCCGFWKANKHSLTNGWSTQPDPVPK